MQLQGVHHITMITRDARRTVAFYADVLGLRLVKKTVNFDAPEAYHLYFGDEQGSPGSLLTWFEFVGIQQGRAGAGMIHTIKLRVASPDSLRFWADRLAQAEHPSEEHQHSLTFQDHDGLRLQLVLADQDSLPLRAEHPQIPPQHAISGVQGASAYVLRGPQGDARLLTETLGFTQTGEGSWSLQGRGARFSWSCEISAQRGIQGAGTVHHIAWHCPDEDHVAWRRHVAEAGMHVTPIIDRSYFKSIYFREPQGILFEIATTSPGFAVDEDPQHLGEHLCLPEQHQHLRTQLERLLTPIVNPRSAAAEQR